MSSQCPNCSKTVYPMEALKIGSNTYHKLCVKCNKCDIILNLKTFKQHDGKLYCKTHYSEIPGISKSRFD